MSNPGLVPTGIVLGGGSRPPPPDQLDDLIEQSAQQYGIDPVLFRRQLQQESGMNPFAVSPRGAAGIAQFMPQTAQQFGIDPMNPQQAIPAAALYMRQNLDANNGDYPSALAGYNWGPGNVARKGLASAPPETVHYVNTILGRPVLGAGVPPVAAPVATPVATPVDENYVNADGSIMPGGQAPPQDPQQQQQIPQQPPQQPSQQPPQQTLTPTGIILGQAPQPTQQTQQTLTPTGIVLGQKPQPSEPPWYSVGDVPGAFTQGIADAAREAARTASGQAFTDQPDQQGQAPRSFFGEAAYGLAHSFPTAAAGIAGAFGGGAVAPEAGPIGPLVGGALGMGVTAAYQALAPGYAQGRQQGMTHDQAMDYALKRAGTEGLIGAATAPLFALSPFKSAVGKMLFTTFATQPAVGTATRVIEPAVTGDKTPTLKELARGAGQDIAAGAAFSSGHALATHLVPKPEVSTPRIEPTLDEPPPAPGGTDGLRPPVNSAGSPQGSGTSQGPSIINEPGGELRPAGGPGDQEGGAQPAGLPAEGIPPEGGRPVGNVQPQGEGPGFLAPIATGQEAIDVTPATTAGAAAPGTREEGGPGTSRVLSTQDGSISTPTKYLILDASELKPATGELQPRDRAARAASDQQIAETAARLDPAQLMAGPTADYGAPVVSKDGTVLAGNGRLAAIQRAQELHPEKYQAYVDQLKAAGHEIPEGMQTPVLVRRTGDMTPDEMRKFALDSNVPRAMAMSPVEQARVDATNLSDEMVSRYTPGNPQFVRDWVGTLPKSEQNRVLDENGRLSLEGQRRLNGALLAKAYGNDHILSRALEDPSDDTKGITNSLADVAPQWAALRGKIATGALPREFDITPNLADALNMVRQQRESGLTPSDMVDQLDLERGKINPVTEELYRSFYNDKMSRLNSRARLTGILKEYAQAAHGFKSGKDLLGEETKPDPAQILKTARVGDKVLLSQADEAAAPDDEYHDLAPEDQQLLDKTSQQLEKLQANPKGREDQIAKLTATRDNLLAKRQPRPRKTVSTAPPKPLGSPKNFDDYKFENGTPVYRDAFLEHAINKLGMSQADAEDFVHRAVNMPIHRQVEILRNQVQDKFGFTDVKIADGLSHFDARNSLLDLHRAAQDMMHALGMPAEMASLMKTVNLNLNPFTERTSAFGSYTPSTRTISLYGRANVFGHEWVHALDHDITTTLFNAPQKILATRLTRAGGLDPANPMTVRMANVVNTLFHNQGALAAKKAALQIKAQEVNRVGSPTRAAIRAQSELGALEKGWGYKGVNIEPSEYRKQAVLFGPAKYWANEAELLARAGEAYIARIMEQRGLDPRGVLLPDEAYLADTDQRLRMTFPKLQERTDIFAAFDHLMDGYRQTALAGSPPAAQALRGGISDPRVWGRLARNTNALGPFRTLVQRVRNLNDTLSRTALTDPNRPDPGARNAFKRAQIWAAQTFHSRMGLLESLHEMVPEAAKIPLQKIMDRLGHTVGSGRYTGFDTIEERAHVLTRTAIGQYANVMHNHGFEPETFTPEQGDHLRHVLTTGEKTYPTDPADSNSVRVPIDPQIVKMAAPLRSISDRFFQQLHDAGVNVGYAKNGHFLRLYDQVRAHSDPLGFIEAASKLHKLMFDREVGTPGDNPDKLMAAWNTLVREQKNAADPAVQDGMNTLANNLRQQRKLEADIDANGSTPAKQAKFNGLQQEAEQLAQDHHDGVGDHIADINANNWLTNLRKMYAHDFDKTGPGGNFLNKRTLPPEADQIMRGYMITDPMTVLPRYYESAARKIAYAERFGAKNEIREQLINDLLKSGMHPQDVALVNHIIDSVSGGTNNDNSRGMAKAANVIHAGAALGLMARAPYSMMAEPFVIGLSHGSMRAGFKSLLGQFSNVMRTSTAQERAELADWIGVTTSAMHDDVMMNRVGTDYSDSPKIGKFMSRFYRATWMTQWTNANRRASMVGGDYLLSKWSRDILNPSDRGGAADKRDAARRVFNELGIAPELHEEFAKWKASLDGMPDIDTVEGQRFGQSYARAMRRIIDRSVIDPKKIERPLATDNKWLGLLWQFQSFNYGFQRNVLDPMLRRWGHAYDRGYERGQEAGQGKIVSMLRGGGNAAWQVGHVGAIATAYVGINMLTSALRQYIFNQEDWQKHEAAGDLEDYLSDLAMSRSGLTGTLDPVVQLATNLRYNQDLSSLLQGPGVKWYAKNFWDLISGFANPSGEKSGSNLRQHEAVKGLYNLIGTPLEAFIATKLAAFGPIGVGTAGIAEQYLTSPQFADDVATFVAGPKGATLPEDKGGLPELPKMEGLPELPKLPEPGQAAAPGQTGKGISDVQGAGAVPWGIMDDFIAPAWRASKPLIAAIPDRAKALGVAGALGYAGTEIWNRLEPYRNAPPPKKKAS